MARTKQAARKGLTKEQREQRAEKQQQHKQQSKKAKKAKQESRQAEVKSNENDSSDDEPVGEVEIFIGKSPQPTTSFSAIEVESSGSDNDSSKPAATESKVSLISHTVQDSHAV